MKSHEKNVLAVLACIISDVCEMCTTDIKASAARDFQTITSRLRDEGMSFVTITLPNFGKDFEQCLSREMVTPADFQGWKRRQSLPAFMRGYLGLIFDTGTGGLLNDPDVKAIEGVRQIAYSFKKLAMQCVPAREHKALSDYEEVESELSDTMFTGDGDLFNKVSRLLWGSVFYESYDSEELTPKHGPGQTAERVSGNRKYSQRTWHERLEPFFPSDQFVMSCTSQFDDEAEGYKCVQMLSEGQEPPVRVVTVPKTMKGPRVIAMEPVCMQYAQQALSSYLMSRIESDDILSGHINFTDQKVNRRLALSASSDLSLATLDLSAASDRVPLSLVSRMLDVNRDLLDAILACRSKAAQLPSGKVLPLKKFASMGSALCFPVEAMYFFTVIIVALLGKQDLPVTLRNIKSVSRSVYVYGDDIIVPVDEVEVVLETLTRFYCKVNAAKSFWTGRFRESCGMDAYNGHEVTPTYVRSMRPESKGSAKEIVSSVATSNLFEKRGYTKTAALLRLWVEHITGPLPVIGENSPGLGWHDSPTLTGVKFDSLDHVWSGGRTGGRRKRKHRLRRFNSDLHRPEIWTYVVKTTYIDDPLSGYAALLKYFVNANEINVLDPVGADEDHLKRSPRRGDVCIKRRWTTAY